MILDENGPVLQQTQDSGSIIVATLKIFGLFPLKTTNGLETILTWSTFWLTYSYGLGVITPILTFGGLVADIRRDPENSVKIRSETEMYAGLADAGILEIGVILAIFADLFGPSTFLKILRKLHEIDGIIPPDDRETTSVARKVLWGVSGAIFGVTVGDLAMRMKLSENSTAWEVLETTLPFYFTYYVVVMTQYKFWYFGYSILKRLKHVNKKLDAVAVHEKLKKPAVVRQLRNWKNFHDPDALVKTFALQEGNQKEDLAPIMAVYEKLCDAVDYLNDMFGLTNAAFIIGILWNLIQTPYLFIQEITSPRKDLLSMLVLSSWIAFQLGRLLFLSQPCQACVNEAQETRNLLCKLLLEGSGQIKPQLEEFSLMIFQRQVEFSAKGLIDLDRKLVTSVLGAVTMYLVILLQFETMQNTT